MKFIKSTLIILVLILSNSALNAQSDDVQLMKNEIGFNVNPLLSNVLPFDGTFTLESKDILFSYKTRIKNLTYLRTGFNVNIISGLSSDDANAFALVKLGVEKKNLLSNSFVFYYGADLFGMLSSQRIGDTDRTEAGIDGVYGFQWLINDRMTLSTEGYLTFSYIDQDAEGDDITGFSSSVAIPRSIHFSFFF